MSSLLVYTVATSHADSFNCTELSHKSLCKFLKYDFDFKIITLNDSINTCPANLQPYLLPVNYCHNSVYDIFKLKYTQEILDKKYDYYMYLDSDILWMYTEFILNNAIYAEDSIFSSGWSRYWPSTDKELLLHTNINDHTFGINAGFFCLNKFYTKNLLDFMQQRLSKQIKRRNRFIEQNMFNLFIYKTFIKNNDNINNIKMLTNSFVNHANGNTKFIKNKAYHFNDKMCQMNLKFEQMNNFLIKNNIIL